MPCPYCSLRNFHWSATLVILPIFSMLNKIFRGFYGWRMVGLVSLIRVVGGGLHQFGFTVFFLPISQDLGLSRAATSLAFSLSRAQGAIEAPLVGHLIDRYGPQYADVDLPIIDSEFEIVEEIVAADQRWVDALAKRGLEPATAYCRLEPDGFGNAIDRIVRCLEAMLRREYTLMADPAMRRRAQFGAKPPRLHRYRSVRELYRGNVAVAP